MDKNDFPLVITCNGFEIREKPLNEYNCNRYRVFHPNFAGVYIIDFERLSEAEQFCKEEDADDWAKKILEF